MNYIRFLRGSLSCVLALEARAHAAESLRLGQAVIRSLEKSPDLAVFACELKAQRGAVQQAGARPPIEVGVLVENAFVLEQTPEAVQLRVRTAKVPQAEEARARAQLARAIIDEEHAKHELPTSHRRLAALWGDTEPSFFEATGALSNLPPLPEYKSLRAELEKNPDFERFVSEQRLRESEARLAETRRRPAWQVTTGVRRFEDGDDHAFVVGLTVPFASRDYALPVPPLQPCGMDRRAA